MMGGSITVVAVAVGVGVGVSGGRSLSNSLIAPALPVTSLVARLTSPK